jgi:macrolide-specific efflux system membrane fusion protein
MKKFLVAAAIILVLGLGAWRFQNGRKAAVEPQPGQHDRMTAKVELRDIDVNIEVNGDVVPSFQLDVKAEVGGKLKSLPVKPGVQVHKGDIVAEIDDRDLQTEKASATTEIEGAQLALNKTQRNLERARELWESKLISREVFDNLTTEWELARNSVTKSQRRLETIEERLRKTKVVAPIDGKVLSVPVIEGQVVVAAASVNSGTTLMVIADLSRLLVKSHVNQVDIAGVELDKDVRLTSESVHGDPMEGSISFIAPVASVKNSIKGFEVEAVIEKPDPRLRPGMSVRMVIPVVSVPEAVSVPIAAVFNEGSNAKVVYVKQGEATEKRRVEVGAVNLEFAEIRSGLTVGEEILLVAPKPAGKPS